MNNHHTKRICGWLAALPLALATLQAAPPELETQGNQIVVKATGDPVRLTGVNIPGLEFGYDAKALFQSLLVAVEDWNCNVIRLPVKANYWDNSTSYRYTVDSFIQQASDMGVYVILDLHEYQYVKPAHVTFWQDAGARYANNPAVLYGLLNEPHGINWDEWYNGVGSNPGMQDLVDAVRGTGANNIVLAGGLDYGYQLYGIVDGYALTDTASGNGIVYDSHLYPWKGYVNTQVIQCAEQYPVLLGEFGHPGGTEFIGLNFEDDSTWVPKYLDWVDTHRLHWTGWSFFDGADPDMLVGSDYTPTSYWGQPAKDRLLAYGDPNAERPVGGKTIGTPGTKNDPISGEVTDPTRGALACYGAEAYSSYFDAPTADGAWTGKDLMTPKEITEITFMPRQNYGNRMVGGKFQVSSTADFSSDVTTLHTISSEPVDDGSTQATVSVTAPGPKRYVRYLGPDGGWCNIGFLKFTGKDPEADLPVGQTMVARYDFENGSDLGEDSSGKGTVHDGSINGSPTRDTGDARIGASSIRLDASQNEYIEVSDHSDLDATEQLTIAFWAKPTSTGVDNNARAILSKRLGYNNNVSYSLFLPSSGGDLRIYLDDGSGAPNDIQTTYTFQTEWQHVALVFDGTASSSERIKLYVNGALFNTYTHSVSQIRDLSGPLTIGALNPGYGVTYDGWLDDIQIHRSALAPSTIADIFSAGAEVGPGPIAYYDFENGSALGEDASANGPIYDGAVYGTSISQNGDAKVGASSVRMNGEHNDYIIATDTHGQLDDTDELTIAFWAKPTSTGVDGNARAIVSKRAGYQRNVSYSMFLHSGGELRVRLDDGDDVPHTIDTNYYFQTNWQHVALVFDGNAASTSRVKLYVDGTLEGTYSHGASVIRDLGAPLTIGALNPGYSNSFDGWLDDIRIYRRALSATEVDNLNGVSPAGYWDFDDGSGSTAMDLSDNNLDISLQGTYSWTTGQNGGALDLGGQSNSYGTVSDPDQLENTDKLTILFWVRPDNLDGNARFVVSKRDGYTNNNAFSAYFSSGNRLYVEIDNNNSNNANKYTSATQFSNGTWYHVAVVYDGTLSQSQRLKVYIDGDLDGNSPKSITSSSIPNQPSDLYLGIANSGYATTFGGRIDDLLFYRAALSEAEVEGQGGF